MKRWLPWLGLCLVLVALGLWLFRGPIGHWVDSPFDDRPFERTAWLSSTGINTQRGRMAEDLRRRFLRRGMARQEVTGLLGASNSSEHNRALGEDWYYLGHLGPLSIEGDYLVIRYDRAGRLVSTEVREH